MQEKPEDSWPAPEYNVGKPKLLHAVGVISMNYNAFENTLFQIYCLPLDRKKLSRKLTEFQYFNLNEQLRLDALKQVFEAYEKNTKVKAVLGSIIEYFNWCAHIRNHILHSRFYAPFFVSAGYEDVLQLVKRVNKKSAQPGYLNLSLEELRLFADAIHAGNKRCIRLYIYLRQRGVPPRKWSLHLRAHWREPLPGKLQTPDFLKLEDYPSDPVPPHLMPSSPR
jgi:hypothetical protein